MREIEDAGLELSIVMPCLDEAETLEVSLRLGFQIVLPSLFQRARHVAAS